MRLKRNTFVGVSAFRGRRGKLAAKIPLKGTHHFLLRASVAK